MDFAEARKHILDEISADELAVIRSVMEVLTPRMYTAQDKKVLQVRCMKQYL